MFPLRSKISLKMALVLITCSWLISFGTALPYIFVVELEELEFQNRKEIKCKEVWPEYYTETCDKLQLEKTGRKIYTTVAVIVMYCLPVIIMVATYIVIVIKLITRKAPGGRTSEAHERKRKRVRALFVLLSGNTGFYLYLQTHIYLLRSADKVGGPFCCCVVFSFLFFFFYFFPTICVLRFLCHFHRIFLIFGQLIDNNL